MNKELREKYELAQLKIQNLEAIIEEKDCVILDYQIMVQYRIMS